MSNETISKWLGECRQKVYHGAIFELRDSKGKLAPDYENDESAWTQELYGKIEEAGLVSDMLYYLHNDIIKDVAIFAEKFEFLILRATPAQKALALSRAIEEVS